MTDKQGSAANDVLSSKETDGGNKLKKSYILKKDVFDAFSTKASWTDRWTQTLTNVRKCQIHRSGTA